MPNPNTSTFPYAAPTDTELLVASDNAQSPLTADIDDTVTSIPVADGTLYNLPCVVAIDSELIYVPSRSGNTLTSCVRGISSTTATAHTDTTPVYGYILATHHNQMAAEMKALSSFTFLDAMKGLGQLENLVSYSELFSNVAWNKFTGSTIVSENNTAPNNMATATSIKEGSGSGRHGVGASFSTLTNGTPIVLSVYAKKQTYDWVCIGQNINGETGRRAWFNVSTGVIGSVGGSARASIVPLANGWYRCIVETTHTSNATKTFEIVMTTADSTLTYSGTATGTALFWGAQVRQGTMYEAQPYVMTYGSAISVQQGGIILDEGSLS